LSSVINLKDPRAIFEELGQPSAPPPHGSCHFYFLCGSCCCVCLSGIELLVYPHDIYAVVVVVYEIVSYFFLLGEDLTLQEEGEEEADGR
jgi:hypothetical protein